MARAEMNAAPTNRARCGIAVMAKASIPGRSKTRLVPPLTPEEAAAFNTTFFKDIAENLLAAALHADIAGYFAYGPAGTDPFFRRNLPSEIGLIETPIHGLGDSLVTAIREVFERGHASAIVLNSDSPTLPTSILVDAAARLAGCGDEVVLGPASDGGYYLLGLNSEHRRLFEEIDWSTERVARQTLERAAELKLPVRLLPEWYDVDDADALRLLRAELAGGKSFAPAQRPYHAAHTAALLARLIERDDLAARLRLRCEVA